MHITRRYFLQSTGALALYCGINPLRTLADVGMTPADVKPVTRGKTFVAVFLRGGMDGLNFINRQFLLYPTMGAGLTCRNGLIAKRCA